MANQLISGFYALADLAAQRVTTLNATVLSTAVDQALAEHNRQLTALLGLFAQRTTDYQLNYKSTGVRSLQPLDEYGRALPTKTGSRYTIGFPIQMGGDAFGQTYLARAKMTVQEVNDELAAMMVADKRWLRDRILAALFTNVDWTFLDPLYGSLTIKPLANGDTVTYNVVNGSDTGTTDTHFLAQAAAIADATNPYPTIYSELNEHPENAGGPVIALIATSLVATTEALATFYGATDPDLSPGTGPTLTGTLGTPTPGTVLGKADNVWIVEWPVLPAGYIVAVSGGGAKPLALREHAEAELQGFKRVAERNDHPWYESQYLRMAGFGAYNRVGAVIQRIGNGTYAIPTNYTAPL